MVTLPAPCQHLFSYNLDGQLACVKCGRPGHFQRPTVAHRPFIAQPHDFARWNGHKRAMFSALQDGQWHARDALVKEVGTKGFTGRISDLRTRGCVIECDRVDKAGQTRYRMTAVLDHPTTAGPTYHCPGCVCKR